MNVMVQLAMQKKIDIMPNRQPHLMDPSARGKQCKNMRSGHI